MLLTEYSYICKNGNLSFYNVPVEMLEKDNPGTGSM